MAGLDIRGVLAEHEGQEGLRAFLDRRTASFVARDSAGSSGPGE